MTLADKEYNAALLDSIVIEAQILHDNTIFFGKQDNYRYCQMWRIKIKNITNLRTPESLKGKKQNIWHSVQP